MNVAKFIGLYAVCMIISMIFAKYLGILDLEDLNPAPFAIGLVASGIVALLLNRAGKDWWLGGIGALILIPLSII